VASITRGTNVTIWNGANKLAHAIIIVIITISAFCAMIFIVKHVPFHARHAMIRLVTIRAVPINAKKLALVINGRHSPTRLALNACIGITRSASLTAGITAPELAQTGCIIIIVSIFTCNAIVKSWSTISAAFICTSKLAHTISVRFVFFHTNLAPIFGATV
jgi:hypothetical protein